MAQRILIAQDSRSDGELLRWCLQETGFEVTLASNGHQALVCAGLGSFDLVVSDVVLAGVDGYELCRRVKERDEGVPVVLLGDAEDPVALVGGLKAGADNFLPTTCERQQLVARLRDLLERSQLRAAGQAQLFMEVTLSGQRVKITAERQQIFDLLLSTTQNFVSVHADLRRQREAAQQQRRLLETVMAETGQAMFVMNPDGLIAEASARLVTLLAGDRGGVVGKPVEDVVRLFAASGQRVTTALASLGRVLDEQADHVTIGHGQELFIDTMDGVKSVTVRATGVRDDTGRTVAVVGQVCETYDLLAAAARPQTSSTRPPR